MKPRLNQIAYIQSLEDRSARLLLSWRPKLWTDQLQNEQRSRLHPDIVQRQRIWILEKVLLQLGEFAVERREVLPPAASATKLRDVRYSRHPGSLSDKLKRWISDNNCWIISALPGAAFSWANSIICPLENQSQYKLFRVSVLTGPWALEGTSPYGEAIEERTNEWVWVSLGKDGASLYADERL